MGLGWFLAGFLSGVVTFYLVPGLRAAIHDEILPAIGAGFRKVWARIFRSRGD